MSDIEFATTADDVQIAYQVRGSGRVDLVFVSLMLNVAHIWRSERAARVLDRLASCSRLILIDRRGTGMSDHAVGARQLTPEARLDDIRAVLDAVDSRAAVLLGIDDGFGIAALFATTYPERTLGLIGYGTFARYLRAPDHPWGVSHEEMLADLEDTYRTWGTVEGARSFLAELDPGSMNDPAELSWFAAWSRHAASASDAAAMFQIAHETDVRAILPTIDVPVLILHRTRDVAIPIEAARYLVEHIDDARLVELPGEAHPWPYAPDEMFPHIESFLTGLPASASPVSRVLVSVLFTDIVGSTELIVQLGDPGWRAVVEQHHQIVRRALARHRGVEIDTAGDGFFATFDGPARAASCALEIVDDVRVLGIEVRAGVHTGEAELIDGKAGGLAVVVGARVAAAAASSQVLATSIVRDLAVGAGLSFDDVGEVDLKGLPEAWHLFRVKQTAASR